MSKHKRRKRIVVLGGGLGSLSAAYWLTEREGWEAEYEITIYQRGWRLGGKGASGRSVKPGHGSRIEEHGPHIWYGFYENAFKTMRRVYTQLAQADSEVRTFASWEQAFTRRSLWTVQDEADGEVLHWPVLFPTNSATPGSEDKIFSFAIVENVVGWLLSGRRILLGDEGNTWLRQSISGLQCLARVGWASIDFAARRALGTVQALTGEAPQRRGFLADFIRRVADDLCDQLAATGAHDSRRLCAVVDLVATCSVGILEDDLARQGFESADDEELRPWLRRHGAREDTIDSHLLSQVYDLIFGYVDGDPKRPDLAAGTGVRGVMRFALTYKGAFMYEMCAGMGDAIFTPLYALLKARGVRFEFFHRVKAVKLDPADLTRIGSIELGRQMRVKQEPYRPLVRVAGIDCWPSEPDYEQLAEGDALKASLAESPDALDSTWSTWPDAEAVTLRYGKDGDFDEVVLGIPVAALAEICPELVQESPRWQQMVEGVKTTRTYCVQLWLNATTEELGWVPPKWMRDLDDAATPALGLQSILCGYTPGLNAWGDFTHLLPVEDWQSSTAAPQHISYFCGALPDPVDGEDRYGAAAADAALASMRRKAVAALQTQIRRLWPRAGTRAHPEGLDPNLLFNPTREADPLDAQYWRVNVEPSERYTLSVAGSTKKRIPGSSSGFRHLFLAGDWTRNGVINVGCVEGAVSSGMEASRAICGIPQAIVGEDRHTIGNDRWDDQLLDGLRMKGDSFADEHVRSVIGVDASDRLGLLIRDLAGQNGTGLPPELRPVHEQLHPHSDALPLDPDRIAKGHEFFAEHGPEIMLVLACYSLPAAYAAAKGARVLGQTRYLVEDPARRLLETAQMVVNVLTPDELGPGARGLSTAKKVRLMHAAIRQLILTGTDTSMLSNSSSLWDTDGLGLPINQEDLLGTLMTFSWVVLDGLERLRIPMDDAQRDAYMEAWRAIAVGLGIKPEHIPASFAEAEVLTRTIQQRQIRTDQDNPAGRMLTASLLQMMRQRTPGRLFDPIGGSLMRLFLPQDVADQLGVPRNVLYDPSVRLLVGFMRFFNFTLRSIIGDPQAYRRFSLSFVQTMLDAHLPDGRPRFAIPGNLRDRWWEGYPTNH